MPKTFGGIFMWLVSAVLIFGVGGAIVFRVPALRRIITGEA